MTPPDTPEAVERLATETQHFANALHHSFSFDPGAEAVRLTQAAAALRAYGQLLRQVEAVRSKRVPLAWTIRPKALKDAINALLDGEPGAQKE